MGFEHWEVGFRKKMGWEIRLVPPPPSGLSSSGPAFSDTKMTYLQGRVSFDEDGNRQSLVQITQNKRK